MEPLEVAARFGVAAGLGLVLGLERERSQMGEKSFAGARTFGFIALLGAISANIQTQHGVSWLVIAAFSGVIALVTVSYVITVQHGWYGATTELSGLFTFLLGCLCGWGDLGLAAALGVVGLLLLSIKGWSQNLVKRISAEDVEAAVKFAVITAIVLPLLPNAVYGPTAALKVLNPYKIWLMVVLISGLNFASYVLVKTLGQRHGIGLTGILGGLVSSTAVTLGFSQRSRQEPALASSFTFAILLAWTVMFLRILVMVFIINAPLAMRLGPGIGLIAVLNLVICAILWRGQKSPSQEQETVSSGSNPFELTEAIKFGVLFGVVTFVAKAAEVYLGSAGLYLAGALAGLTDVDAISLSMANLAMERPESLVVAARTILIAALANTLVKGGMAVFMGAPDMRKRMLPVTLVILCAGVAAAFLIG